MRMTRALAAVTIAAGALALLTGPAEAATAPVARPRIIAHLNLAAGQTPENLALAPDGSLDTTFSVSHQIARIGRRGTVTILATLPASPAAASPFLTGIVRATDGAIYVGYAAGTSDYAGIWRLKPGGTPQRIIALPANSFPNGMALDPHSRQLYIADSTIGVIWRAPVTGGVATEWATGTDLKPTSYLGANGLKLRGGAVWVSNLDLGTLLRIPIDRRGKAGQPQVRATGLAGIDDFTFVDRTNRVLAALDPGNQVALIQPNGSHTIVLTAADGLRNPTSFAVRGNTVYVANAAYSTGVDPNLLAATIRLGCR